MTVSQSLAEKKNNGKYVLNTPKRIIQKLDGLISNSKIQKDYKKVLVEIKGILVGKYPTLNALKNSVHGLQKKYNTLMESKNRIKATMLALLAALSIINSAPVKAEDGLSPDEYVQSTYKTYENYAKSYFVVELDEEQWSRIEAILDRFKNDLLSNEGTTKPAFDNARNDFAKENITMVKNTWDNFPPEVNPSSGEIRVNDGYLDNPEPSFFSKGEPSREYNASLARDKLGMGLRSSLVTLKQIKNSKEFKNLDNGACYVGQDYANIKYLVDRKNEKLLELYLVDIEKNPSLANIVDLYPSSDPVVKAIKKYHPKGFGNMDREVDLNAAQQARLKKAIQELLEKGAKK